MGAVLECDEVNCKEFFRGYGRLGGMGLEGKAEKAGWTTHLKAYRGKPYYGVHYCPNHRDVPTTSYPLLEPVYITPKA